MPMLDCTSMPGLSMSMAWLRLPGQSWVEAAASFVGMWTLMTAAMMLPSLAPVLRRHRLRLGNAWLTLPVAAGYLLVWASAGLAIYPFGACITELILENRVIAGSVPLATGASVLLAGLAQFTRWKAKHLACCRSQGADAGMSGWRHGVRHGLHCVSCCGNLMAAGLVMGVMNLPAMAAVTAAIVFERLCGNRAAHAVGLLASAYGVLLIVHP